jgi:[ribosomal protein S18]-alanine N-acetyltransferase
MAIRPMTPDDVNGIASIEQTFFSPWSPLLIASELERPNGLQFVAVDKEDVVGWCCGLFMGTEAELLKITVAQSQRGCGVGAQLLHHLEDRLRDKGCDFLFLEVRAANMTAIRFYEALGYIKIGYRKNYYNNPPDDAWILEKSI